MLKGLFKAFVVCFSTVSVAYWLYLLGSLKFLKG